MDNRYLFFPQVAVINQATRIECQGLEPGTLYRVSGFAKRNSGPCWERELRADSEGQLRWVETFPASDEYMLDLYAAGAQRPVTTGHIFALPPDLAYRRPLRCDFHIHTYYSDGHQSPTEMAIRGRELGLDLLAITDHDCYPPSQEAIAGAKRLGLNLICLPGEEVSFETWDMLSIAADVGIKELFETAEAQAEIAHLAEELAGRKLAGGLRAEEYAPVRWVVQAIHRHGGQAFLCHPYWVLSSRRYHLDMRLYDQLVADAEFDGVELLGEVRYEDNLLSIAHYQGLVASGQRIPIIGCSDTHDREHYYGCYWTIVFAKEPTAKGALAAIADGYSVACSTVGPTGKQEGLRIYGPLDLVEYALFLEREFFPLHDALCREEAQSAYATYRGEKSPPTKDADWSGKMARLYSHSFPTSL